MQLCIQQTLVSKGSCKGIQSLNFSVSYSLGIEPMTLVMQLLVFSEKPVYVHRRITFNQSFLQSISTERSPDTVNCSFYVAIFLIENSVSKDDLKL